MHHSIDNCLSRTQRIWAWGYENGPPVLIFATFELVYAFDTLIIAISLNMLMVAAATYSNGCCLATLFKSGSIGSLCTRCFDFVTSFKSTKTLCSVIFYSLSTAPFHLCKSLITFISKYFQAEYLKYIFKNK